MIDQHTIARERYLIALDAMLATLGREAALLFMRQATSAIAGNPSPMSVKRLHDHAVNARTAVSEVAGS